MKSTLEFWLSKLRGAVFALKANAEFGASLVVNPRLWLGIKMRSFYKVECWRRPQGCACHGCEQMHALAAGGVDISTRPAEEIACEHRYLAWAAAVPNLVMDGGINELLDKFFKGSSYTAAFFVGLVDNASFSAYAAGDTMASHAGWLESTAYSNGTRPSLTLGTVAAKSVDNSASKAVFNINATATIRGAFVPTNSTKGGTTGILYGAADFAGGNRAVLNGDTLNVQVTLTGA